MKNSIQSFKTFLLAGFLLFALYGIAIAVPIVGYDGLEGLGSFEGDFSYSYTSDTTATIDVSLTNTSPEDNGGYLTSFAFLFPETASYTDVTFSSSNENFSLLDGSISAPPYDDFDLGGSSTSNWLAGGSPEGGIFVGDFATFTFSLLGEGFLGLDEQSFFNAGDPWFVARFRGFLDGGSDKVPAKPPSEVPEPAIMFLFGIGLVGMATLGNKRKF